MTSQLDSVVRALEAVDNEIQDLETNLENARKKKADLMKKKYALERATPQDAPQAESPEELQARIAELQKQIQEAEKEKKVKAMARARSRSPSGRKLVPNGGVTRSPQGSRRQLVKPGGSPRRAPASPDQKSAATKNNNDVEKAPEEKKSAGWRIFGRGKKDENTGEQQEKISAPPLSASPAAESSSPPKENVDPVPEKAAASEQPSQRADQDPPAAAPTTATVQIGSRASSDWQRPGWAHAMNKEDTRAVDSDSIANPLLQQADNSGYRRQVFAKDLDIQRGNFVKNQARPPDPRLAWIVVRINGTGVPGKIVMHLYGKDIDALVDQFLGLKDTSITCGGPNRASFTVESSPPLYITSQGLRGLDSKPGVYGVIQEGHDIVDKVVAAGDGAQLAIKQAHIFPVKKSKGGL